MASLLTALTFPFAYQLTKRSTGEEVARHSPELVKDGHFRGEQRWALRIRPCDLDIDMIVLTFTILEKRRIEQAHKRDHSASRADEPCEGGIETGLA